MLSALTGYRAGRALGLLPGVILSLGYLFLVGALFPSFVFAQATLENPAPDSFQSGLGVISGWACHATTIEIAFNDGPPQQAASGTSRGDTQGTCGDTDNGFGLLFNWNLLGDGIHTVSALADGVEFASVTVIVTTFGEEFLREASGVLPLSDFPDPGATRTLRWQEGQQNFVLTDGRPGWGGGTSGTPPHVLENPAPGSFQSGLGLISGWVCEAQTITIRFDDGPPQEAAYGTSRGDTQGACGDTDNGFGLLFNWNLLGDGLHTVAAYADGVEFASVTVTVTTLGTEFLRGVRREVTIPDFPTAGTNTMLRWQEAQQNFVITQTISTSVSAHFIPDANLRRAVGEALGKPPGAIITKAELATLRMLDASENNIADLTGLEFATNLTELSLSLDGLEDLTPLAGLTNLTRLDLSGNGLEDLTPLAGLTNLTELDISFNNIEDLTPLAGLTNLTELDISFNNIVDLTPLAGLTNLTRLDLSSNYIEDLTPLAGLTNLTELDISFSLNYIEDLTPLAGLTNLTELHLSHRAIEDLTFLASLTNLTELHLSSSAIEDLTFLADLTNLTGLYLSSSAIEDLTPLASLTNLTELGLWDNAIEDLTPLAGLTNLTELSLSGNAIEDLTPLAGLTNLTELSLSGNAIEDLTPLASLTNLKRLDISHTSVTDLVPLFSLTKLFYLNIDGAPVRQADLDTLIEAGVTIVGTPN